MKVSAILKEPSAFVPVLVSLAALATVVLRTLLVGTAPEPDEGTTAHIWQLLMGLQVPLIAFHAVRCVRRNPKLAIQVLGIQAGAVLAALAPAFVLRW